jgi:hypothetical protein
MASKKQPKAPITDEQKAQSISAKHIVCFWKQNDLGLFGRRPDRWINTWMADKAIQKVIAFEPPLGMQTLHHWLQLAASLDPVSASEYTLLLNQHLTKRQGLLDKGKLKYKSYFEPQHPTPDNSRYLNWVLQQLQLEDIQHPTVVLWPACYVNASLLDAIAPEHIVTDLVDDQRLFTTDANYNQTITQQYAYALGRSDRVISNSEGLIASFSQEFQTDRIQHHPNALLSLKHHTRPTPKASGKGKNKRPVIGYVGNMRGRMAIEPLLQAIDRNPDKDFWFVGQTHGSAFYQQAKSRPNCKFWGTLSRENVARVMAQFSAGLIPFQDDPLVRSMSPIKADVYAKANVPVVSLDEL